MYISDEVERLSAVALEPVIDHAVKFNTRDETA